MSFSGHWELRLISNVSRLGLKIVVMTREQGTGNREEDLGNFTFRYLCRFFSDHLLISSLFTILYWSRRA
ncbi:MAG: hypothetical protein ACK47Y_06590 [Dolichospermum sp.]